MRDRHASEKLHSSYYEALGRLLVAFQALEEAVTYGLIQLTRPNLVDDTDLQYFYAVNELPFKARVKLMRNFLETTKPSHFMWTGSPAEEKREVFIRDLLHQMLKFAKECQVHEDQRNQFVHSVWEPAEEKAQHDAKRLKLRLQEKKTLVVHQRVSVGEILELVERMQQTRNGISNGGWLLASILAEKRANAA